MDDLLFRLLTMKNKINDKEVEKQMTKKYKGENNLTQKKWQVGFWL